MRPTPFHATLCVIVLASFAGAQDDSNSPRSKDSVAARAALGDAKLLRLRTTEIRDLDVLGRGEDPKRIATVKEVMIDVEQGLVPFLILIDANDSERFLAVPTHVLHFDATNEKGKPAISIERPLLQKARIFKRDEWKDGKTLLNRRDFEGEAAESAGTTAGKSGTGKSGKGKTPAENPLSDSPLYRSGSLFESKLSNEAGEKLGTIHDLVFDAPSGKIAYVVVATGGTFGLGKDFYAVPMTTLVARDAKTLAATFSQKKLEKAPAFSKDEWPDDDAFVQKVHSHFGTESTSQGSRAVRQAGSDDLTSGHSDKATRFALHLEAQHAYHFEITEKSAAGETSDESGRSEESKEEEDDEEDASRRSNRSKAKGRLDLTVERVEATGGAVLSVTSTEQGAAEPNEKARVTIDARGEIQTPTDLNATLRDRLEIVLGAGLHGVVLNPGESYSPSVTEPLKKKRLSAAGGRALSLTFLDLNQSDRSSEVARFEVDGWSHGARNESRASGRALYRTSDGLLESLTVKSEDDPASRLVIRRLAGAGSEDDTRKKNGGR